MKTIDFNDYEVRKRFAIRLIIATSFFVIACIIVNFALRTRANTDETLPSQISIQSTSSTAAKKSYIIKIHEGKIAIFEKGNDNPFRVLNTPINNLPEKDHEILNEGIEVDSQKELNAIIEDYCS